MKKREQLAAYAHEAWSGWMKYVFITAEITSKGFVIIPPALAHRWERQTNTDHGSLPENEKESDCKEADLMLRIMQK